MILAALAALVIHTYDGQDKVISDIEPGACEMSRCVVLWQKNCGQVVSEGVMAEMVGRKLDADQAAWAKANPKAFANCFPHDTGPGFIGQVINGAYCGPRYGNGMFGIASSSSAPSSATKSAMCIRQRGDDK